MSVLRRTYRDRLNEIKDRGRAVRSRLPDPWARSGQLVHKFCQCDYDRLTFEDCKENEVGGASMRRKR